MQHTMAMALQYAAQQITALEADILLTHALSVSRSYVYANPEQLLTTSQQVHFFHLIERRLQGEPIAYITGHREFWSLDFIVTPNTLIPRPETELLVELILEKTHQPLVIADLGTGSGAIALSLAKQRPNWQVHATDVNPATLDIAKLNAERLNLTNVTFHLGSWCAALPSQHFDLIVSNPPYIAEEDMHLTKGDLRFEPRTALVSGRDGLDDLRHLIYAARTYLKPGAFLFLEHGFQQAAEVASIFQNAGYTHITVHTDLAGLERVTIGRYAIAS